MFFRPQLLKSMMIFSFDCAIKNLGFCCLEINDNWRDEVADLIVEIENFYLDPTDSPLDKMQEIVSKADLLVDSIIKIKYMNIFDLAAEGKARSTKYSEVVKRLKYILYCLEKQLPSPDIVLIEYQMNVNDKARGISRYIEEYYLPIGDTDATITYAMNDYPLIAADLPDNVPTRKIYTITASLKNAYQTDPTVEGSYQTFIEKYNRNYDANKAHTTHNFTYFLKSRGLSHTIENIPNKLDDISDSFMQAYAWCKASNIF